MQENYYKILGLDPEKKAQITAHEIKLAYYRQSKIYHPDKYSEPDKYSDIQIKQAAEQFKKINEAYAVLYNSNVRQTYDNFGCIDPVSIKYEDLHGIKGVLGKIGAVAWIYILVPLNVIISSIVFPIITPLILLAIYANYISIDEVTENLFGLNIRPTLIDIRDNPISSLIGSIFFIAVFTCIVIGVIKLTLLGVSIFLISPAIYIYNWLQLGLYQQFATAFYVKLNEGHVFRKVVIGIITAVFLLASVLLITFPPVGLQLYITMLTTATGISLPVFGTIVSTLVAAITISAGPMVSTWIDMANHELSSTTWQARMSIIAPIAIIFALAAACIIIFPPAGVLPFISILVVNLGIESFAVTTVAAMAAGVVAVAISSVSAIGCMMYDADFTNTNASQDSEDSVSDPDFQDAFDNEDDADTAYSNSEKNKLPSTTTAEKMATYGIHNSQSEKIHSTTAGNSYTPLLSDSVD